MPNMKRSKTGIVNAASTNVAAPRSPDLAGFVVMHPFPIMRFEIHNPSYCWLARTQASPFSVMEDGAPMYLVQGNIGEYVLDVETFT